MCFAELKVEVNLNAKELADLVEDLDSRLSGYFSKPVLTRLVAMKASEYVVSECAKEAAIRPTLRDIVKFIENSGIDASNLLT